MDPLLRFPFSIPLLRVGKYSTVERAEAPPLVWEPRRYSDSIAALEPTIVVVIMVARPNVNARVLRQTRGFSSDCSAIHCGHT